MSRAAADAAKAKMDAKRAEVAAAERAADLGALALGARAPKVDELVGVRRVVLDKDTGQIDVAGVFAVDVVTAAVAGVALLLVVAVVARRI